MRDTQREAENRQREKQAPCREPNVGLDPGTPGSCPGRKAGAKPLNHPGIPYRCYFFTDCLTSWGCKVSEASVFPLLEQFLVNYKHSNTCGMNGKTEVRGNFFFFKDFIHRHREADVGGRHREADAGSPTWDSIPGLQDHTPGHRRCQTAAPPGLP